MSREPARSNDSAITNDPVIIQTTSGKVKGLRVKSFSYCWLGIPFARPPVGSLRWRAPLDPEPWDGIYEVDNFRDESTQWVSVPYDPNANSFVGSEDCLYLNIWKPQTEAAGLPVYFWIHGGANNTGSTKDFRSSILSERSNLVVVTVQYRLGPLGWFSHPAFREEEAGLSELERSGNFGTLDLIKALKWVRDNIAGFGGDPDNVTIAGESAGAYNVTSLMVSPEAEGLFHKAISQSGGMLTSSVAQGDARSEKTIERLLLADGFAKDEARVKKDTMSASETREYLMSKSAEELIEACGKAAMEPHDGFDDGKVIRGKLVPAIKDGGYAKVPIMLGSNEYETKYFQPLNPYKVESTGRIWSDLYRVAYSKDWELEDVLGTEEDKMFYEAVAKQGSLNWRSTHVDTVARLLKELQDGVFCYYFRWGGKGIAPEPFDFIFGPAHALEIPFFFGGRQCMLGLTYSEENRPGREELQKIMMGYMANFCRTGNPNGEGLPAWEEWSNLEGGPKCVVFDADLSKAKVEMMNEEVTLEQVRARLATLKGGMGDRVREFFNNDSDSPYLE